jgi:acetyl esterase/lipase
MSQYLVAIHLPDKFDPCTESEATVRAIDALSEEMAAAGVVVFVGGLTPVREAKSLRAQPDGKVLTTDGPYLETKEHIGGSNRFGWTSFLGVPAGSPTVPARAVPARVENLAGLPPAFIGVGALDLFVDEDVEYARRLINAGVSTELHVIPGAYHGFDVLVPDAAVSKRFTESWIVALRRAFATG